MVKSLSSWRAWIEILQVSHPQIIGVGRSPHGERGLKYAVDGIDFAAGLGRSPHGERGLKCLVVVGGHPDIVVALLMESVD